MISDTLEANRLVMEGVTVVDSGSGLTAIHEADCAAVIWARPACPVLSDWLATLPEAQLPQAREILRPAAIRPALERICAHLSDTPARAALIDSTATLAAQFADVMHAPWLRLRLEVVTGNACRKFHIDNVTARLVCTFRGTGTQIGLADGGAEPEVIHTVAQGQPIVLRGARWPATPPRALKHRSPPIEGTGETRLLLVLDPIVEPEEDV